jgi:hypothetical protein
MFLVACAAIFLRARVQHAKDTRLKTRLRGDLLFEHRLAPCSGHRGKSEVHAFSPDRAFHVIFKRTWPSGL